MQGAHYQVSESDRGASKEVSRLSLTPDIDRITQGIMAGKPRTRKFTLIGILLGDPQEFAGRRERFRADFLAPRKHRIAHSPCRKRGRYRSPASCNGLRQRSVGEKQSSDKPWEADPHSRCSTGCRNQEIQLLLLPTLPSRFLVSKTSVYSDAALSVPMLVTATSCIELPPVPSQLSPRFASPFAAADNSRENGPKRNLGPLAAGGFPSPCQGTRRATRRSGHQTRRDSPCLQTQSRTKKPSRLQN